jgi:hypothetical protein
MKRRGTEQRPFLVKHEFCQSFSDADPVSGGWNFYSINTTGGLGHYPKFGIWPDGIYMSANMFNYVGQSFQNVRLYAFTKRKCMRARRLSKQSSSTFLRASLRSCPATRACKPEHRRRVRRIIWRR